MTGVEVPVDRRGSHRTGIRIAVLGAVREEQLEAGPVRRRLAHIERRALDIQLWNELVVSACRSADAHVL